MILTYEEKALEFLKKNYDLTGEEFSFILGKVIEKKVISEVENYAILIYFGLEEVGGKIQIGFNPRGYTEIKYLYTYEKNSCIIKNIERKEIKN